LSVVQVGVVTNRALLLAAVLSLIVQFAVLTIPAASSVFKVAPLSMENWELIGAMALLPLIIVEAAKWIMRLYRHGRVVSGVRDPQHGL
ncbi:MAG TPA: cation transporting ATPase C-terminal domain-containing protein, partial [Nitrospira sp.]|nr:cation transporting ATPase C-terminal domain-containing protein [Nitrospira sp.]